MGSGGDGGSQKALDVAEGLEVAHPIASWLLAKVNSCLFVSFSGARGVALGDRPPVL